MYCGLHTTKQCVPLTAVGYRHETVQHNCSLNMMPSSMYVMFGHVQVLRMLLISNKFVSIHQRTDMQLARLLPKARTGWLCCRPHSDSSAIPALLDLERISQNLVLPPELGHHLAQPDHNAELAVALTACGMHSCF